MSARRNSGEGWPLTPSEGEPGGPRRLTEDAPPAGPITGEHLAMALASRKQPDRDWISLLAAMLIPIVAGAVAWGVMSARVEAHDESISSMNATQQSDGRQLSGLTAEVKGLRDDMRSFLDELRRAQRRPR